MSKILDLKSLAIISKNLKKKGKKIVLCHGVFDLLHVGHIKHFKKAKKMGDKLIVSITPDRFVNKGPNRPVFNQILRSEAISSLEDVDYVGVNETSTAVNVIRLIKPDIYCKGKDYKNLNNDITGEIKNEIKEIKKYKGKIIFTEELTFSSSRLINTATNTYSKNQKKIINIINKTSSFKKIKKTIENFKKLKILVIGETIIDRYSFCEAVGKSGKEPMLVLKEIKKEDYFGGVINIAVNLKEFSNKLTILSMIGEKKEYLKEIKKFLPKNIKSRYIFKDNSPTIIKKRYIDSINGGKVLGIYNINDENLNQQNEKNFINFLKKEVKKHDLVITSDYGHGLISKKSAEYICKNSKFLALNAQVNASNIGYHTIRNYKNFNVLIINEKEIRHEMRDKISKLEILMSKLSKEKKIENLIVTSGEKGAILFNLKRNKFFYIDAYASKIVDKVGAGDAMLSLVSPCLKLNLHSELALLISSLAAAQSVESIGNKNSINKLKLLKTLENLVK